MNFGVVHFRRSWGLISEPILRANVDGISPRNSAGGV
jgi:hypothetical protein